MKISVKVKPSSKESRVEGIGNHQFLVKVKAPPKENKANQAVIAMLADYFNVPKSRISILTGFKSSQKIVKIEET